MKTKQETLENIHDYILEDMLRNEVEIRSVADLKDDDEVTGYGKPGRYGMVPITKKEFVSDREKRIKKLENDLVIVDTMIEEGKGSTKKKKAQHE